MAAACCTALIILLLLYVLATILIVSGNGQLECYRNSEPGCSGAPVYIFGTASPRECCLGDGYWYRLGPSGECVQCIVHGFETTAVRGMEGKDLNIEVHLNLKGPQPVEKRNLRLNVHAVPGTAVASDYNLRTTDFRLIREPVSVSCNLQKDSVALEGTETFQLQLQPESASDLQPNEFLRDVSIEILDNTSISFKFLETDYASQEGDEAVTIGLLCDASIQLATDLTLHVTPLTYKEVEERGLFILPGVPANASQSDFDNFPVKIVLLAPVPSPFGFFNVSVPITNDEITEREEGFMVILEVASAVDPSLVDLSGRKTATPVATVRIIDDDPYIVGIEQGTYTVSEADGSVEVCAIVIRSRGIESTRVTLTTMDGGAAASKDYTSKVEEFVLNPVTTRSCIVIQIINDVAPEIAEDFIVRLTVNHTLAVTVTEIATVTINDNDEPEESCSIELLVLTATQERNQKVVLENVVTVFPSIFADSDGTEPTSKEELFASVYSSLAEYFGRTKSETEYNEFVEAMTEITEAYEEACSGPLDERPSLEDVPGLAQQFFTLPLSEVQELQRIFGKMICINSNRLSSGRKRRATSNCTDTTCPCRPKVICPCDFFACLLEFFNITRQPRFFGFSIYRNKSIPSCLAFVLDTTGSMWEEIAAVKNLTLFFIANEQYEPACYVVTLFNNKGRLPILGTDYGPARRFDTANLTELQYMRDNVTNITLCCGGGGFRPCGEYALRGIKETLLSSYKVMINQMQYELSVMVEGSQIIVITDEPAQEPDLADEIIRISNARNVCIHFILTTPPDCGSESDYDTFKRIAADTGGRVIQGTPDELTDLIILYGKFNSPNTNSPCIAPSMRGKRQTFPTGRCHPFRVSAFIEELNLFTTLSPRQSQATIHKPHGKTVNIKIVNGYGGYVEVGPEAGEWSVCVASGTPTVSFNNRVLLDFMVKFMKEDERHLMTTSVPPPACSTGEVLVATSRVSDISSAHLNFIRDGSVVARVPLALCGGAMVGNATFPLGSVTYQLEGEDIGGNPFESSQKTVEFKPGKYSLTVLSDPVEVDSGESTVFIFRLDNLNSYGSTNFTLSTESTDSVRAVLQQTHTSLKAAESAEISVSVMAGSSPGDNRVTAVASDGCTHVTASQTLSIRTPEIPTAAPDVCGCKNGGTCIQIRRPGIVFNVCGCPVGYVGLRCDILQF